MGYCERTGIITPEDDKKIWRYMSFEKFVSLLEERALFFVRSNKFRDTYEGIFPKKTQERVFRSDNPPEVNQLNREFFMKHRESITINCWHMNEFESAAMWDLYINNSQGIAIQSTISDLKNSFRESEERIYIGEILYLDYTKDDIAVGYGDGYSQYLRKRKSFEHEKEVRVIYNLNNPFLMLNPSGGNGISSPNDIGVSIKCDIECLINKIYVSPESGEWFVNLVKAICKKYELESEVIKSNLYDKQLY
ncbi:TPA: DUF2971 domain-containing protein [Bacillus cereus]